MFLRPTRPMDLTTLSLAKRVIPVVHTEGLSKAGGIVHFAFSLARRYVGFYGNLLSFPSDTGMLLQTCCRHVRSSSGSRSSNMTLDSC